MDSISITLKWAEEIAKKFGTQPIKSTIKRIITMATIYMQWLSRQEAPTDQGQLRWWISVEITDLRGSVFNTMKYWDYVHQGTGPHFPNVTAITGWANRHWISPWALAFSISKKGTKANPYFDRATEKWESKVNEIADREMQNLVTSLN